MKVITVYFDDYDKPVIGRAVVNDEDVEAAVERLTQEAGEDYLVEVGTPNTVEDLVKELHDLMGVEDE